MQDVPAMRLMKMNAKEWHYMTLGCISALLQGSVQPIFALIFGIMLGVSFRLESLHFISTVDRNCSIFFLAFTFLNT